MIRDGKMMVVTDSIGNPLLTQEERHRAINEKREQRKREQRLKQLEESKERREAKEIPANP